MARAKKSKDDETLQTELPLGADAEGGGDGDADEVVLEGSLICALTGDQRIATPQEEMLQWVIEQLHREYSIDLEDMERDVRVECERTAQAALRVLHGSPRERRRAHGHAAS